MSTDKKFLISHDRRRKIILWDVKSGRQLLSINDEVENDTLNISILEHYGIKENRNNKYDGEKHYKSGKIELSENKLLDFSEYNFCTLYINGKVKNRVKLPELCDWDPDMMSFVYNEDHLFFSSTGYHAISVGIGLFDLTNNTFRFYTGKSISPNYLNWEDPRFYRIDDFQNTYLYDSKKVKQENMYPPADDHDSILLKNPELYQELGWGIPVSITSQDKKWIIVSDGEEYSTEYQNKVMLFDGNGVFVDSIKTCGKKGLYGIGVDVKNTLWMGGADGSYVYQYSIEIGAFIDSIQVPNKLTTSFSLNDMGDIIRFENIHSHECQVFNTKTKNNIYNFISLINRNWIITLPNSPYYMCSKDASKMLHYVTPSLKVIGFDQLDPVYNRPDIVLDSIGKYFGGADQELIALYKEAWEKRIDRLGLDKEMLASGEIAVPDAEIVNEPEYSNTSGVVELKIEASDPKYELRRFNVLVNEVPIYGSRGVSISDLHTKDWDTTLSVALTEGENKLQVVVMNELGLQNFKYPEYVNYTPEQDIVSKTVYIGIGVNEFTDATATDLKYCVSDVQDLGRAIYNMGTADTLTLTNNEVTRENVRALKDYLQQNTSINDRVIVSCSSHGLLDNKNNFYLAMHNTNFSDPTQGGLPYAELEELLDSIPARRKLMLIDACNSGDNEILEHEQEILALTEGLDEKGRGIKLESVIQEQKSAFETMMGLFVNVQNETGSVVISAAGGKQSALEAIDVDGKTIANGAFTYSVLEYLNSDKDLTVNGLKTYVENRVVVLTNGAQQPTSRQETMEVDWELKNIK